MEYKLGQELQILMPAVLHGIEVKGSFQLISGMFVSKTGTVVCAKVVLHSTLLDETLLCVEEGNVFDNFQKAIEHIHTTPVSAT